MYYLSSDERKYYVTYGPPFYGWPDFFGNAEPVTEPKFQSPRANGTQLQFLMQAHPPVERPLALIEHVAAATGVSLQMMDLDWKEKL